MRTLDVSFGKTVIVAAAVLMMLLAGCGERPSTPTRPHAPAFTDPGTDLFVWDDVDAATGASPKAEAAVRTVLADLDVTTLRARVTVDYPLEGTLFPPDLCAPTFLWHDADNTVNAWLIDVAFEGHPKHVYVVASGKRTQRPIDPRCVTDSNVYEEPAYDASAKGWTPDVRTWSILKERSRGSEATVTVYGLVGTGGAALRQAQGLTRGTRSIVSRGSVTFATSTDPVGAPVFYRDVPLMPSTGKDGIIQPLAKEALPLIQWRLRDLSKPDAPVVMEHLPTCANCHTFSADGRTLAMDMDGPDGDKGAHVIKTVSRRMVIETGDVFTWNSFTGKGGGQSFGLLPQISPDGRHAVATVHELMFVQNYMQWQFLQTFYPTRGILAIYTRETGEIRALPGADDERYVQSNATWRPDGKELVFIRAEARDAYGEGPRANFANDPNETQIRYDLYRIPFNEGKGGTPEPVKGASNNEWSHSFPRFSPDGKWIVFVRCKNGLLMRPDGKLCIIPAEGGEAREMRCNTPRMNSYHSFSPNGRWMVFSSKWPTPYTQMYLTHIDVDGRDTPPVLVPNSTAANRAVNLPEFAPIPPDGIVDITTPAVDYRRHFERGKKLLDAGRVPEAIVELRTSLRLKEDYPLTHSELAAALSAAGNFEEAIEHYRRALELNPRYFVDDYNWGNALRQLGRTDEAIEHYRKALEVEPKFFQATNNLGIAFYGKGDLDQAASYFEKTLEINPEHAHAHNNLAVILEQRGKPADAVRHLKEAVRIDPDYVTAANRLAWILATHPDAAIRDGAEALRLARDLCRKTGERVPGLLLTLSAAEAETGAFDAAVRTAERALALARAQRDDPLAATVGQCLEALKQRKPLRQ
ncbi:MAG TPA: tetratricopeptide repeat protein [Planctomycetota bacterium]|nr:tetratricopeptide repeat protein [Planctomycetota bacterium]